MIFSLPSNGKSRRDCALLTGEGFSNIEHSATGAIDTLPHRPDDRSSRKRRGIRRGAIEVRGQEIAAKQGGRQCQEWHQYRLGRLHAE